jgi:hypothetical protein
MKVMTITFNALGEGSLVCQGYDTFRCLGKKGLGYPKEVTLDPSKPGTKQNPHYSVRYSCPPNDNAAGQCTMRFSILIWPRYGVYIHEWPAPATYTGNGGSTHGCIHLDPGKAALVYAGSIVRRSCASTILGDTCVLESASFHSSEAAPRSR